MRIVGGKADRHHLLHRKGVRRKHCKVCDPDVYPHVARTRTRTDIFIILSGRIR